MLSIQDGWEGSGPGSPEHLPRGRWLAFLTDLPTPQSLGELCPGAGVQTQPWGPSRVCMWQGGLSMEMPEELPPTSLWAPDLRTKRLRVPGPAPGLTGHPVTAHTAVESVGCARPAQPWVPVIPPTPSHPKCPFLVLWAPFCTPLWPKHCHLFSLPHLHFALAVTNLIHIHLCII